MERQSSRKIADLDEIAWTTRQRQVLDLIAKGHTNPEIGERLGITLDGAKWHVSEVLSKLGVNSREEAAAYWRARNRPAARLRRSMRAMTSAIGLKLAGGAVVAAAVVVAAVMLVVNRGAEDGRQDAPGSGATPTVTDPLSGGRAVAYARGMGGQPGADGRMEYVYEVRLYDLDEQRAVAAFTTPPVVAGHRGLLLRGDRIYANHPDRIDEYSLDGTHSRTIVSAPDDRMIVAFDISPDGGKLAYWLAAGEEEDYAATLVLFDAVEGGILAEVGSDAVNTSAVLYQEVRWDQDGSSVLTRVSQSSHTGAVFRVDLDGSVTAFDMAEGQAVAPNLRTAFYPVWPFGAGCGPEGEGPAIDKEGEPIVYPRGIRDLRTNDDFWQIDGDRVPWGAIPSPDGSMYLVAELDCPSLDEERHIWSTVSIDDPIPRPVERPEEVLRDWYGDRTITNGCEEANMFPMLDTVGEVVRMEQSGACYEGLVIDGFVVDEHREIHVLGFVQEGTGTGGGALR